jgi:hypothetical protein
LAQKETNIWRQIMLDLSPLGIRLFRNQRYKGPIVRNGKITEGYADCGVGGDGGSDLIGYQMIRITQDMVGKMFARFVAFETKTKTGGNGSDDQKTFISAINNAGGKAGIARSTEDAKKILDVE